MDDLVVQPGPGIPRGLIIPARELDEQFTHASGPGGQGVNTTDSRVQLTFNVETSTAFTAEQRQRILVSLAHRLANGALTISAAEFRSQLRNRVAARERLASVVRDAMVPPVPRRATKPTIGSKRRRVEAKRARSETKQHRRRPAAD